MRKSILIALLFAALSFGAWLPTVGQGEAAPTLEDLSAKLQGLNLPDEEKGEIAVLISQALNTGQAETATVLDILNRLESQLAQGTLSPDEADDFVKTELGPIVPVAVNGAEAQDEEPDDEDFDDEEFDEEACDDEDFDDEDFDDEACDDEDFDDEDFDDEACGDEDFDDEDFDDEACDDEDFDDEACDDEAFEDDFEDEDDED